MTAAAPAATVLPNVTLQPNMAPALDKALEKSINEKPVTEKTVDRILTEKQPEKAAAPAATPVANLQASGVTPLSPSALSAAVAPSAPRANLRVVPPSPLAASLPAASATMAKVADAPMQASMPAAAPNVTRLAEAPMQAPPLAPAVAAPPVAPPVPVMPAGAPTARHEEHNFRVLAVDDSPLMRTFLQNKLQPYGIHPEFAASGEEALFKISKDDQEEQGQRAHEGRDAHEQGQDLRQDPRHDGRVRRLPHQAGGRDEAARDHREALGVAEVTYRKSHHD
jgi:hypothetical protein